MMQYAMWFISFVALYLSFIWISILYLNEDRDKILLKEYPAITIAVPAYNEAASIEKTVESLMALKYPKNKLRIVIIDDGSVDKTKVISEKLENKYAQVWLISKDNAGKAAALNSAIEICKTDFFACVDADSTVEADALVKMMHHFEENKVAAVISAIKVNKPKTIYERLQKFEYIIAILSRKLMASIDTLAMTPGVLSVYKTDVLREVGLFDDNNITEDFEIALRLKYKGYAIRIAEDAVTWTNAPNNFFALWRQRIRWYRGFIDNHIKYKDMFFSKKHGLMGYFQLPLNVFGVFMLLFAIIVLSFESIVRFYEFVIRTSVLSNYFKTLFYFPTLKEFILSHNMKIMFPIYLSIAAGFFLFYAAHKAADEKLRNPVSIWVYFFFLPYLTFMHWIGAIYEHVMGVKKKW